MFLVYLVTVNALSFLLMLSDKQKAKKKKWRIPEATLLGIAALGGSIGAICGMFAFRHKTRHLKFRVGLPLILGLQIIAAVIVMSLMGSSQI